MNKFKLTGIAALFVAFAPMVASAYELPIENDEVPIEAIVNHFNGESIMDRDEDGNYYNEYIFNGHIIQVYSGQSVAWIDGEPKPFLVEEKDGVLLPKPYRVKNTLSNPRLPAEFLEVNFGYKIDGDMLIFDEESVVDEKEEEEEEVIESVETIVDIEDVTVEEDTDITELPKDKAIKEEVVPEEVKDSSDDTNKEEVKRKLEKGKLSLSIDKMNYALINNKSTGVRGNIEDNEFVAYFKNQDTIVVEWLNNSDSKTIAVSTGTQIVSFPVNNDEFYSVEIDIKDSREEGLTTEAVVRYINQVDEKIIIHSGSGDVKLTYLNDDADKLQDTFLRLEDTLSFLGIEQFKLEDTEDNTFIIQFNVHDSSWSL